MPRRYHVCILASRSRVLYTGMTNSLVHRVHQHRTGRGARFGAAYKVTRLVYVEEYGRALDAIAREKELKAGTRAKKVALINAANPQWQELLPF